MYPQSISGKLFWHYSNLLAYSCKSVLFDEEHEESSYPPSTRPHPSNSCKKISHPNLQLYPLVVPVDGLDLEVDAYCADKGRCERVICVTEEEGGLSDAAVPDDEDFKHVIKVLV